MAHWRCLNIKSTIRDACLDYLYRANVKHARRLRCSVVFCYKKIMPVDMSWFLSKKITFALLVFRQLRRVAVVFSSLVIVYSNAQRQSRKKLSVSMTYVHHLPFQYSIDKARGRNETRNYRAPNYVTINFVYLSKWTLTAPGSVQHVHDVVPWRSKSVPIDKTNYIVLNIYKSRRSWDIETRHCLLTWLIHWYLKNDKIPWGI